MRTLLWYRGKDLRIADHAPLRDAARAGEIIPLFVLDPYFFAPERARALPHRMQFLLGALTSLAANLRAKGSRLLVVAGRSVEVIPELAKRWQVDRVLAHRWVEPFGRERDRRIAEALEVPFDLYEGETLHPPGTLRSGSGTPYSVYSAFARAFAREQAIAKPLAAPSSLPPLPKLSVDEVALPSLAELGIEPNPNLIEGGERAAKQRLRAFLRGPAASYHDDRDRMDRHGTSRLSADLKFGTLSVRRVWHDVQGALGDTSAGSKFLSELVWREFTHSTLWDRPEILREPFRADFVGFPWREDERGYDAWARGLTGYPIVDAAARQLLAEGYVHNRARMIAASFLTKHLLIHYRHGEAHYLRFLVDGDWAQNNAGWQWSAGSGCDAQPYFRVFNPVTQGKRYDPEGAYVRRWVGELAQLPDQHIHAPWLAPEPVLEAAGVELGVSYPLPIVDHATARERFLSRAAKHLRRSA